MRPVLVLSLLFVLFAGCRPEHTLHYNISRLTGTDSTEIEKHGDSVFKYFMSYDKKRDRYFRDATLTRLSVFRNIPNDTTVPSTAFMTQAYYLFFFDRREVERYSDSSGHPHADYITALHDPNNAGYMGQAEFGQELLDHCRMHIVLAKDSTEPKSLLIERFSSRVERGTAYSIISAGGDTLELFNTIEYRY